MAHDVFVSHSVKDKATADRVVTHLESDGIRCWVAPRDVMPGADWGESIIDAIESSRAMILIFSANANGSSQIKREVERAVDKDVYTIPFRIDNIEPTRSLEYFISTSQWMDAFPPPLEPHLEKLSRTVKAVLSKSDVAPAPRVQEPPAPIMTSAPVPTSSQNWPKFVMLGGAAVLVFGGLLWSVASVRQASHKVQRPEVSASNAATNTTRAAPAFSPIELNENAAAPAANLAANTKVQQATEPLNALAAPAETVAETSDSAPPIYSKKGGFEPPAVPSKGSYNAAAPVVEDPAAVVRRYYDNVNRRDPMQAYNSFSQGFRGRQSYDRFAQVFNATRSITLRQAEETKRDDNNADVSVAFAEVDAEGRTHQWEGHVLLVKENDDWRINQMLVKQQVAAPTKKY